MDRWKRLGCAGLGCLGLLLLLPSIVVGAPFCVGAILSLPGLLQPECLASTPLPGSRPISEDPGAVQVLGTLCNSSPGGRLQDVVWHDAGWLVGTRVAEAWWWSADGSQERPFGFRDAVSVSTLPDGAFLVGTDGGKVEIWRDGEFVREVADHGMRVSWAGARPGDPADIASVGEGGFSSGNLRWIGHDAIEGRLDGTAFCGAWSPDGHQLAICEGGTVSVHDTAGVESHEFDSSWVYHVAWSPDIDRIAVAANGKGILLLDGEWNQLGKHRTHSSPRGGLAWSPDGSVFAVATYGSVLWMVDREGREVARFDAGQGNIQAVAWSDDGTQLATAGSGGSLRIWGIP